MSLGVLEAFDDSDILGGYFDGPSWSTWRTVLRATYGRALNKAERKAFDAIAERRPPSAPVRELWAICGRRAGKDSIASGIATCTAALHDYSAYLRPGERATVACIARDRQQARIVLNYIKGYFAERPMLGAMVERETADGLDLNNRVEIIVITNDYRALRGRAFACIILDECAFYQSESSSAPDVETYNAALPGLTTLPNAILIGISSPWKRSGLLYERWAKSYGRNDPHVLVVKGASRTFNPTLPQKVIDDAMARDPQAARAEWLAEWRDDLAGFLSRDLIEAAVEHGVTVRPPCRGHSYIGFADLSGGVHDSSACGIAHAEGEHVVLDALYERRAPHSPEAAIAEISELLRSYFLSEVHGDKYASGFVIDAFSRCGISYHQADKNRSELYLGALPMFTSGRVSLIDNPRMVEQFAALERRTYPSGQDKVNHPSSGADDASNAAAGALVLAQSAAKPTIWFGSLNAGAGRPRQSQHFFPGEFQ